MRVGRRSCPNTASAAAGRVITPRSPVRCARPPRRVATALACASRSANRSRSSRCWARGAASTRGLAWCASGHLGTARQRRGHPDHLRRAVTHRRSTPPVTVSSPSLSYRGGPPRTGRSMGHEVEVGPVAELVPGAVHRAGRYAVGNSADELFAVTRRCRHLGADLADGSIDDEGCLVCPWHGASYDVASGRMTRGPQGILPPATTSPAAG